MEKDKRLIPDYRTIGFHRKYHINSLREFISLPHNDQRQVIAYARVSTQKQKKDLILQQHRLHEYCQKNYDDYQLISDLGSGLNYNKKGLKQLIHLILSNKMKTLILNYKDRLLRFGSELIFKLCHFFNIEVIILNDNQKKSFEQEFCNDVLEVLTVFSAKLYGSRSKIHKKS
tara:strand:- start:477 stop:995 length:519 start_codon:yes stop_codon:yes gene_type:complete